MNNLTLFKIKTFLYYLVVEPWTEKVSLPNFRSLIWVSIIVASLLRLKYLLFISLILGVALHLIYEYRSGKFIYWYKKYKRKKFGQQGNVQQGEDVKENEEETLSELPSDKTPN